MIAAAANDAESRTAFGAAQCIEIAGEDARAFAQAQFSGDVRKLEPGYWQWNAWLDAQGRVRALMHLACLEKDDSGGGRLLALLRGGESSEICASLQRYVLRARVSLQPLAGLHRAIGAAVPVGEVHNEAEVIGFGYGERSLWLTGESGQSSFAIESAYRLAEIRAGWPSLLPGAENRFLPPALGLEHLGAVGFDKGCYPGQEIAARLHYRGGHKLGLCLILATHSLTPGQPLSANDDRSMVLDAVEIGETCEALVVFDTQSINALDDKQKVLQRFKA